MLLPWWPRDAYDALRHIRGHGGSRIERALAASIVIVAIDRIAAKRPPGSVWLTLLSERIARDLGEFCDTPVFERRDVE